MVTGHAEKPEVKGQSGECSLNLALINKIKVSQIWGRSAPWHAMGMGSRYSMNSVVKLN